MNESDSDKATGASFGLGLVALAAFFLFFARDIGRAGLVSNGDPGPRIFPVACSLVLLAGGLYELARWGWARRRQPIGGAPERQHPGLRALVQDPGKRNAASVIVALAVYIPAIAWLGFAASSLLFCTVLLIRLGARWWSAVLVSVLLLVVIELLFVYVFKVPLPSGELGLPF